ncbi:MAG: tRNA (adenosine(37)-N6)-threonylcarbamoyltransferase complex transferase subunit TsaD, partial [Deltaproteobacteria bacterium]|nr:tRNA (adenosine(37)-N6)-threonylcarbamoyltransferase complex transferase subunit TsaD [Deltaproteobacteria bacterium]
KSGSPKAIPFPRARIKKSPYDFSFSGLKTAVLQYIKSHPEEVWSQHKADIAASFQEAVVDMLIAPTLRLADELKIHRVVLAGG